MNRCASVVVTAVVLIYCGCGQPKASQIQPPEVSQAETADEIAKVERTVQTGAAVTQAALDFQMLDKILAEIAAYKYGKSQESFVKLTDFVRGAYGSTEDTKQIERRLLLFLRSDATLAGKQFVCKQLSIIGTDEAVPTLAGMLTEATTADMARYALERIPGVAVDDALRDALNKASGKVKVGIINTLGVRRDSKSVSVLRNLIYGSDLSAAAASVSALGSIGGFEAAGALAEAGNKTGGELRLLVLDAYLQCARNFAAENEQNQALGIYQRLYTVSEPEQIRIAALRGIVTTVGDKAVGVIVEVLRGEDHEMQAAAIGLLKEVPAPKLIEAAVAELPNLRAAGQVQLLSALADCNYVNALPVVVISTRSEDGSVRVAALKALGQLGGASSIGLLAQAAAKTSGAEQEAARESLYRLRGLDVDGAILASIPAAESDVKIELVRSIGQRNIRTAVETLLKIARDADFKVRIESIKALKIASPKYLPTLIELLINVQSDAERKEVERTVVAVAKRIADKESRADAVLSALDSVKEIEVKCSLLSVLGEIGNDNALKALRSALKEKDPKMQDAAVRALSEWSGTEPMSDLLTVAQASDNRVHRVLALRGFIRMIGIDKSRSAEETVKLYSQAMGLSSDINEKKMVLSGLSEVNLFAALQMAADFLDDEGLRQEAAAAVVKIAKNTRSEDHPEEVRAALQKAIEVTAENKTLQQQAREALGRFK